MKDITELIQEREGAYTDYQDASALKYSHVQATARSVSPPRNIICYLIIFFSFMFRFLEIWLKKIKKKMGYSACSGFSFSYYTQGNYCFYGVILFLKILSQLWLFIISSFRNNSAGQNPAGNIPLIGGITGGIGKLFGWASHQDNV